MNPSALLDDDVESAVRSGGRGWLYAVLALVALAALAIPLALMLYGPKVVPTPHRLPIALPSHRTIPAAELPQVEPVELVAVTPEDARAYNASIPFVDGPIAPARPYRFPGGAEDRARAVDCLATAQLYEAGDDSGGERAVAQVIVNRVRHPAYPKSVCGVVFQGSERSTGCQFSFTCDGALNRWHPSAEAWARARAVASSVLSGSVDKRVGWATHYHTNWVVPYWQSSLDKIAQVGTHLFFRWTGWWGTPGAFRSSGGGVEPAVPQLAALSDVHRAAAAEAGLPLAGDTDAGVAASDHPAPVAGDPTSFLVTLPASVSPDAYPLLAMEACGERPKCKFSAWRDGRNTPRALPLSAEQVATMSFSYLRDRPVGIEKLLWNCQQSPRSLRLECMKVQVVAAPTPVATPTSRVAAPTSELLPGAGYTPRGPAELTGVRRRPGGATSADPNSDLPPQ